MYTFPDSASILSEAIAETSVDPMFFRPAVLDKGLPIAVIYKTGGAQSGPLATDVISVDVYGIGRDATYAAAEEIRKHLTGRYHSSEQYGLVDFVRVETSPLEVPYLSDTVNQFSATYSADTRAL